MVGSSASATAVDPSFLSAGLSGGIETSTGLAGAGSKRGNGAGWGAAAAAGAGAATGGGAAVAVAAAVAAGAVGSVATAGPAGRPLAPGINEKSSANDDEIHGTCSLRDARVTPTRVRLSVSSAIRSGTRISLSNSCTNRL